MRSRAWIRALLLISLKMGGGWGSAPSAPKAALCLLHLTQYGIIATPQVARPKRSSKSTWRLIHIPIGYLYEVYKCTANNVLHNLEGDLTVFRSSAGTPYSDTNLLARHLKPTGRQIGTPWLGWHTLRRTHATLLSQSGSPKDARAQLEHTHLNHHGHLHATDTRTSTRSCRKDGRTGDEW